MSGSVCPMCSRTFLESKIIEAHVNKCLDGDGDLDEALFNDHEGDNTTVKYSFNNTLYVKDAIWAHLIS